MTTGVNGLEDVYKLAKTDFSQMKLVIYAREQQLKSWKSNCDCFRSPFNSYGTIPTTRVPYYHTHLISYDHSGPGHYDATKVAQQLFNNPRLNKQL